MSKMDAILASGILDAARAKVRAKKETYQKTVMDEGNISGEAGPMKGPKSSDKEGEAMQVDNASEKKAEAEPSCEILSNPARVVPAQEKYIKFFEESRYVPTKLMPSGFVLLRDTKPSEPEVFVLTDAPSSLASSGNSSIPQAPASAVSVEDGEPQPPQPFEYNT